jgi:monofunctional biosynthetic peptidoglycan transglycosylase
MARKSRKQAARRGGIGRVIGWGIRGFFLFVVLSVAWVLLYALVPPPITFTMIGDMLNGRSVTKDWMPLEAIDDDMKRAAIAGEDSKFCSHNGFDQDAIAEAMRRNARGGRIRGGSTISQQTAKNAFLWQGGGYFRKGLEAWFTLLIETMWSKPRIMEVYLNIAETGIGTYGANAGAQRYFKKDASNLSRSEAARIAAVLPLPKQREAVTPGGFTRRYGNSIAKRIGVVQRDGLDACLYDDGDTAAPAEREERPKAKREDRPKQAEAPAPPPEEDIRDYIEGEPLPPEDPEMPAEEPAEPEPIEPDLNGL